MIKIYSKDGDLRCAIDGAGGQQEKALQGDNILSLSFTLYEYVQLDVNDYVDFGGERYWLTELYKPTEKSSMEWSYSVQLYGVESLSKRWLMINYTDGEDTPIFSLTAPAQEHARLVVTAMNRAMGQDLYKVGEVVATGNLVIDYNGTYCNEAMDLIAKAANTEYWFENGITLNFSKAAYGEELTLGYGKGLKGLEREKAENAKFYTRLMPIGSTRNIEPGRYGHTRLQLPDGQRWVDKDVDKYGVVHHYEEAAFAGIYPRRIGTVSSARQEEQTDRDGKPFTIYYFKDNDLPFDPNDYEIGGLVKRVSFQEGELAGQGTGDDHYFEVNYDSEKKEFEIITQFPSETMQLPGGVLVPKVGDKYILWNIRMPDEYYAMAEQELLEAARKYNEEHFMDSSVYKGDTDHVWVEDNGVELFVGRRVRLESPEYFPETGYRQSRITKMVRKVALPSQVSLEISDAIAVGRIASIEAGVTEAKQYAMQAMGGMVDVIASGDDKVPGEHNVYSARRAHKEFLSKLSEDIAQKLITFLEGIAFKEGKGIDGDGVARLASVLIGKMFGIDRDGNASVGSLSMPGYEQGVKGLKMWLDEQGRSHAQVDFIEVLAKAVYHELEVRHMVGISGDQMQSAAASVLLDALPIIEGGKTVGWKCHLKTDDGTTQTLNTWVAGDQAYCHVSNLRLGTSTDAANRTYWRVVSEVAQKTESEEAYIVITNVAPYYHEGMTDAPQAGDSVVQFGYNAAWAIAHGIEPSKYANRMNVRMSTVSDDSGSTEALYRAISGFDYSIEQNAVKYVSSDNIFLRSKNLKWLSESGAAVPNVMHMGEWPDGGTKAYAYESWQRGGSTWLCLHDTTDEPSPMSPDWQVYAAKGSDGVTSVPYVRYSDDGGKTFTSASQKASDEVLASWPLEYRNLADCRTFVSGGLTIINPKINHFKIVAKAGWNKFRIQNLMPWIDEEWQSKQFVISGYVKASSNVTAKVDLGDVDPNEPALNITSANQYFELTFNRAQYLDAQYKGFIDFAFNNLAAYTTFEFTEFKIGIGSHATSYSEQNIVNIDNAPKFETLYNKNLLSNSDFRLATIGMGIDWYPNGRPTPTVRYLSSNLPNGINSGVEIDAIANGGLFNNSAILTNGQTYTLSLWAKGEGMQLRFGLERVSIKTVSLTKDWQRYDITFSPVARYKTLIFYTGTEGTFAITGIKVELGSTATDWTPALEDTTFGTTEGTSMGVAVWDKPYPPLTVDSYTWSKIQGKDGRNGTNSAVIHLYAKGEVKPSAYATSNSGSLFWDFGLARYTNGDGNPGIGDTTTDNAGKTWYLSPSDDATWCIEATVSDTANRTGVWLAHWSEPYMYKGTKGKDGSGLSLKLSKESLTVDFGASGQRTTDFNSAEMAVEVYVLRNGKKEPIKQGSLSLPISEQKNCTVGLCDDFGKPVNGATSYIHPTDYARHEITGGNGRTYKAPVTSASAVIHATTADGIPLTATLLLFANYSHAVAQLLYNEDSITASVNGINVEQGKQKTTLSELSVEQKKIGSRVQTLEGNSSKYTTIEQTDERIRLAVGNMQVGSANLLKGASLKIKGKPIISNTNYVQILRGKLSDGSDNPSAHNGHDFIRISRSGATTDEVNNAKFTVAVTPGTSYVVSAWAKVSNDITIDGWGGRIDAVAYDYEGGDNRTFPTIYYDNRPNGATIMNTGGQWVKYAGTFTVPEGYTFLELFFYLNRNGRVSFSEIQLEEGTIPTTWHDPDVDQMLEETGIDIRGRKIVSTADNFEVRNNKGEVTMTIDADGNLVTSGDASFKGNVTATGGTFHGTVEATGGDIGGVKIMDMPKEIDLSPRYQAFISKSGIAYTSNDNGRKSYITPVNLYPKEVGSVFAKYGEGLSYVEGEGYSHNMPMHSAYVRFMSDMSGVTEKGIGYATNARVIGSWFETTKGARGLHVYAYGRIYKDGTKFVQYQATGWNVTSRRTAPGCYKVTYGNGNMVYQDIYTVFLQGVMTDGLYIKTSLETKDAAGFTARTSNDETPKDGDFEFLVLGMGMSM